MPLIYGPISPIEPGHICDLCPSNPAVKAYVDGNTVYLCDLHAFVHSDLLWQRAEAIYDGADILPPKPE